MIWMIDYDPAQAALYLPDQMLRDALNEARGILVRAHGEVTDYPVRIAWSKWASAYTSNYDWMVRHQRQLITEIRLRFKEDPGSVYYTQPPLKCKRKGLLTEPPMGVKDSRLTLVMFLKGGETYSEPRAEPRWLKELRSRYAYRMGSE